MLIYIHGFNSGSHSIKAALLRERLASRSDAPVLHVPSLSHAPCDAVAGLDALIRAADSNEPLSLIGSSLGAYYAMWLGERYPQARIVLLNPAVRPYELLSAMLGAQRNPYTGDTYTLSMAHMAQLLALRVMSLTNPERYFAIVESADEVVDYREAMRLLPARRILCVEGGDHAMSDFPESEYIDTVLDFCISGALSCSDCSTADEVGTMTLPSG